MQTSAQLPVRMLGEGLETTHANLCLTSCQNAGRGFGNKANYCCWEFLVYIDDNNRRPTFEHKMR